MSCSIHSIKLDVYAVKQSALVKAIRLLPVKCYDNKMVKSPYNWVIFPLTQPLVAKKTKTLRLL